MNHSTNSQPQSTADWARRYKDRGWSPIPLKHEDKAPESTAWQRQSFADDQIDAVFTEGKNIGLLLGPPSGNLIDVDLDCPETVRLAPHFLPETGLIFGRTSKPQSHYLYQADPSETIRRQLFQDPDGTTLLEIRGDGHQTMVPSSTHPSGEPLAWSTFDVAGQTTVEDLEKRAGWLAAAAMMGRHWSDWDHRRHYIVLHLSGGLLRAGISIEQVKNFVKAICILGGESDWDDREKAIDSTAEKLESGDEDVSGFPKLTEIIGTSFVSKIIQWLKITSAETVNGDRTDTGNAERLLKRQGDDIRYDSLNKRWLIWDSTRWAVDEKNDVVEMATESARAIFEESAKESDDDKRKRLAVHAAASLNRPRIAAAIALARSKPGIAVVPDELDRNQWFLNVQNGTINLLTGGLQAHDRRDLIAKLAPVMYDPDAKAPIWDAFIDRVMGGDPAMTAFLQRWVGYCLTGDVSEQVFAFLYGDGQNGKSKFVEALFMVLGDYAGKLPPGVLTKRRYGSDPTDLQDLPGKRFVVTNETARGGVLDDALIKDITGGDRLVGRKLYGSPFEFDPTHKIVMYGNHKPTFSGTDKGIRRRPLLIPFDVTIPEQERDPNLSHKFARELPGILAWAVEGTQEWRRIGLDVPAKVRTATDAYIDEQDVAKRFLDECTVAGRRVDKDDLFAAYVAWAKQEGEESKSSKDLMSDMTRLGVPSKPSNGKYYRMGIRLTPEWARYGRARGLQVTDSDGDNGKAAFNA